MENTLEQNTIAFASAGFGALVSTLIGVSHRQLCALISFAAGTLLATTLFHIIPEAWTEAPLWEVLIALASGYFLFFLISRYVFHVCPACSASHFDDHMASKFTSVAMLLGIALSIHSIMDGMAISMGKHFGKAAGHSIFVTITVHKLPEGLALCALFLKAGYNKARSFLMTLAFEMSTFAGWFLGNSLLQGKLNEHWLDLMLAHIGGGFVYLAFHATLNEAKEHSPRLIFFFFLLGVVLIGITKWMF